MAVVNEFVKRFCSSIRCSQINIDHVCVCYIYRVIKKNISLDETMNNPAFTLIISHFLLIIIGLK